MFRSATAGKLWQQRHCGGVPILLLPPSRLLLLKHFSPSFPLLFSLVTVDGDDGESCVYYRGKSPQPTLLLQSLLLLCLELLLLLDYVFLGTDCRAMIL